jgi:hypothetical protein
VFISALGYPLASEQAPERRAERRDHITEIFTRTPVRTLVGSTCPRSLALTDQCAVSALANSITSNLFFYEDIENLGHADAELEISRTKWTYETCHSGALTHRSLIDIPEIRQSQSESVLATRITHPSEFVGWQDVPYYSSGGRKFVEQQAILVVATSNNHAYPVLAHA